ncbi:P-loop containing nucleoside triphosphate hydrolase protein [Dimargaris cristalligena]|uniref:Mitochondrial Rho GTPase n=1 Tax=Dimargaris cristalligena TaxID=215637 RepID=A0A4P9ZVL6_9FUNG|nr:P-loop containing nucleoside triphosphate hydrolase protein [Dimargaris cristalligena]|eukprot:RKP37676.1 P-loop containing nucleoside triphosphate hydrolase protein [Dimargaris cristalligena]
MPGDIRILLVGDSGVGKSTLIATLIKEDFVPEVQPVVPEITIPPELTSESVTTHLIDSSPEEAHRHQLAVEIRKAHAVGVVYALDQPESAQRVTDFWLPYLKSFGTRIPVLVIGNKQDLVADTPISDEKDSEEPAVPWAEWESVEAAVKCSAKQPAQVTEVFYLAQKAVLYPTSVLWDRRDGSIRQAATGALERIFQLCDDNHDGLLDDQELNAFQTRCFGAPLHPLELASLRSTLQVHFPEGISDVGLTPAGFLFLHRRFIERGRSETTWRVLRVFGYDTKLELREDFLFPTWDVPSDCRTELSPAGRDFLTQRFKAFDQDGDGALNATEMERFFQVAPSPPWPSPEFPDAVVTVNDAVPLASFLAQWHMTAHLDPDTVLSYLAYLGYPDSDSRTGLQTVKARSATGFLRVKPNRVIYRALLIGAPGAGKQAMLRAFVGKPLDDGLLEKTNDTFSPRTAVRLVSTPTGVEKYLILEAFPEGHPDLISLLRSRRKLARYDVLGLVYDGTSASSFRFLRRLREQYDLNDFPQLLIQTHSDQSTATYPTGNDPAKYCRHVGLVSPLGMDCRPSGASSHTHVFDWGGSLLYECETGQKHRPRFRSQ